MREAIDKGPNFEPENGDYPDETEGVDDPWMVAKVRSNLPRSHYTVI